MSTSTAAPAVLSAGSIDPYMPLVGSYFHSIGKTAWLPILAKDLDARLASDNPPEFRTVSGIIGNLDAEMPEGGWRTLAPMYFDIDAADIADAIAALRKLLGKFRDTGLDLGMCRIFASGVKGFHVEIPMACFMASIPAEGIVGLHKAYKEIAYALWVDDLDSKIYSGRSGRMWRVPNRQRSGGTYKVPLTVDEALNMTAESYAELVSAPRPFPPLLAPAFCAGLALIFANATKMVEVKAKVQRKASGTDKALKIRFGEKFPPTLAAFGQGRFPAREDAGWNRIVIQLSTAAHALGIDEEATVAAFQGLIDSHQSDGRYNSSRKREAELRRMYDYVGGSATYSFSVGGIRSILPQGLRCNDFRGL